MSGEYYFFITSVLGTVHVGYKYDNCCPTVFRETRTVSLSTLQKMFVNLALPEMQKVKVLQIIAYSRYSFGYGVIYGTY